MKSTLLLLAASLTLIVATITVANPSPMQAISADTGNSNGHFSDNKNSEHQNGGLVTNNDGGHYNTHCVGNSNNDKGLVCHTNSH